MSHHIFVVATVRDHYQALAVVQYIQTSASDDLERCHPLLQVFQAVANRIPIQQEIRQVFKHSDVFWEAGDRHWSIPDEYQPFPFVATCLLVASSFDPELDISSRAYLLPFNSRIAEVYNDGSTVIDLSDLDCLRLCFTDDRGTHDYLRQHGNLDDHYFTHHVQSVGPKSYFLRWQRRRYGNGNEQITNEQSRLLEQMGTYKRFEKIALHNTWGNRSGVPAENTLKTPAGEVIKVSLRRQMMDQVIVILLQEPFLDVDVLAVARQYSDFEWKLRSKMKALAQTNELLHCTSTTTLLEIAFSGECNIDLSLFGCLTAEQLVQVAQALLEQTAINSLDLSHLTQLSEAHLETIFAKYTPFRLTTIYLLEMPHISKKYVTALIEQLDPARALIYHTEMFRQPLTGPPSNRPIYATIQTQTVFKYKPAEPRRKAGSSHCPKSPVPAIRIPAIKNILWVRVIVDDRLEGPSLRNLNGSIDWQRSTPDVDPCQITERMFTTVMPLDDLPLSPTKLVTGLTNFLTHASEGDEPLFNLSAPVAFAMAKAFATAPSDLDGSQYTIGPLPEQIFQDSSLLHPTVPHEFPPLEAGEASIVIINEHCPRQHRRHRQPEEKEKLRLAVITPQSISDSSEDRYDVMSMENYLELVMRDTDRIANLLCYWKLNTDFPISAAPIFKSSHQIQICKKSLSASHHTPSTSSSSPFPPPSQHTLTPSLASSTITKPHHFLKSQHLISSHLRLKEIDPLYPTLSSSSSFSSTHFPRSLK
ncbi:MAG: hypothetical protein Q9170_001826 [Blastenia crenularia]